MLGRTAVLGGRGREWAPGSLRAELGWGKGNANVRESVSKSHSVILTIPFQEGSFMLPPS